MPQYKVIIGFGIVPEGSTETYITGDVNSTAATILVNDLLNKRKAFLDSGIEFAGVRISDTAVKRSSQLFLPGEWEWPIKGSWLKVPAQGSKITSDPEDTPIPYRNAMQLKVGYGPAARFTAKYLVGIPKGVVSMEPGNFKRGLAKWYTDALDVFCTFLASGSWYVKARRQDGGFAPAPVDKVLKAAPAQSPIQLQVGAGTLAGLTVGQNVTTSGFRMAAGVTGTFNGKWKVDAIDTTSVPGAQLLTLHGSEFVQASDIKTVGTVQRIDSSLQVITSCLPVRIAEHKRGGPFTLRRGRQRIRVFLGG